MTEKVTKFIGTENGGMQVVPAKKKGLPTRMERIEMFRDGIHASVELLKALGFHEIVSQDERTALCEAALAKGEIFLDFKVVRPEDIAFVTTSKLYNPDKAGTEESNATIINGADEIRSDYALRTVLSFKESIPVFRELFRNDLEAHKTIVKTVLGLLRQAARTDERIRTILEDGKEKVEEAEARLLTG